MAKRELALDGLMINEIFAGFSDEWWLGDIKIAKRPH